MPAGARWLFWLTWLLLGLAVFMLAALLSMWRHRQGRGPGGSTIWC
ncbi:MAG: hypothetical protein R2851_13370 [Caldilineaceae bacterium]